MNFEYCYTSVALGDIEIQNIGDVCLHGTNDFADHYLLLIQTTLGWTEVFQFGPYCELVLPLSTSFSYKTYEFNKTKIIKDIDDFVNKSKAHISNVEEVDKKEIFDQVEKFIKSLKEGERFNGIVHTG